MWMTGEMQSIYPNFTRYMAYSMPSLASVKPIVANMKAYGQLNADEFKRVLLWGNAPQVMVVNLNVVKCGSTVDNAGCTRGAHSIEIDRQIVIDFEVAKNSLGTRNTARGGKVFLAGVTLLHELCHWGHMKKGIIERGEAGNRFERATYGGVIYY